MNKPSLETIPVVVGTQNDLAKVTVFKSGSRGYRAIFKAIIDVSGEGEESDLRRYQTQILMTEIGSKGQEEYVAPTPKDHSAKSVPAMTVKVDESPRLAPTKS